MAEAEERSTTKENNKDKRKENDQQEKPQRHPNAYSKPTIILPFNNFDNNHYVLLLLSYYEKYHKYATLSLLVGAISIATMFVIAADECRQCFNKLDETRDITFDLGQTQSKTYWVYGKNVESGYLKHVFAVLDRLGYKNDPNNSNWDLLWAHDYPFNQMYNELRDLKPHQKVNHLPGCGYVTNKVDLATSNLKYIPAAFKLPDHRDKLQAHALKHPNATFVQKNNNHRNIKVRKLDEIDVAASEGTFVQEFVDRPLLVSGHKFDIGIYTIVTSVDPLRVYVYNGDALLRFCPVKYYPFDPENLDKYVVGDDYLPIWEVPALDYYYNNLNFGMRESLNAFLESQGRNPHTIWRQIEESIRIVLLAKEPKIIQTVNKFKSKRNFFEMMRFDFVVDEDLNVFLLEANMSPNLSSAHYPPNQLLYEQVLYSLMGLLGLGERVKKDSLAIRSKAEEDMIVSEKNLATFPKECSSVMCKSSCVSPVCQLCKPCLSSDSLQNLRDAYKEHLNRGDCKRIFPPTKIMTETDANLEEYSAENQLQYRWFQGKCQIDSTWC